MLCLPPNHIYVPKDFGGDTYVKMIFARLFLASGIMCRSISSSKSKADNVPRAYLDVSTQAYSL